MKNYDKLCLRWEKTAESCLLHFLQLSVGVDASLSKILIDLASLFKNVFIVFYKNSLKNNIYLFQKRNKLETGWLVKLERSEIKGTQNNFDLCLCVETKMSFMFVNNSRFSNTDWFIYFQTVKKLYSSSPHNKGGSFYLGVLS